jgi:hypothetical protein
MINNIDATKVDAIRRNSVAGLGTNEPSRDGISAEALKNMFIAPVISGVNSLVAEINRIVGELNIILDGFTATITGFDASKINASLIGIANGICDLDANGKVPLNRMNDVILGQMTHAGQFNADTKSASLSNDGKTILGTNENTITLTNTADGIGGWNANNNCYYIVSVAGTFAGINYDVGDWVTAVAGKWDKVDNTDAVASVNDKTGVVVLTASDVGAIPMTKEGIENALMLLDGWN